MTSTLDTADMKGVLVGSKALQFILAGNATVTFRSIATQTRYTYKVSAIESSEKISAKVEGYFVSLLVGPDNWSNYCYIGLIRNGKFSTTAKSKYPADSTPVRAFSYVFGKLANGYDVSGVEIWHEGKCGKCGRKLTVPESIESGIGPICMEKGF